MFYILREYKNGNDAQIVKKKTKKKLLLYKKDLDYLISELSSIQFFKKHFPDILIISLCTERLFTSWSHHTHAKRKRISK